MARTKQDYGALKELMTMRNVGKATAQDLILIGVNSIEDLKSREPDEMYLALCRVTKTRQDPCVWDVFAASVHFARTGEARDWWDFTPERKARADFKNLLAQV